jgi:ketosteroid isomerase-like protein
MKPFLIFSSLLIVAAAVHAQAPTGKPPARVIPTVTRTIQIFSTLENQWLDAVQRRDQAALKKLVAADFEQRTAAAPGTPTPREEAIDNALKAAPFQSSISQMAAHEYGELVMVSFLWTLQVPAGGALPQKVFVVDTWKRGDGEWQVVTRYAAPVTSGAAQVPGSVTNSAPLDKKI